MRFCGRLLEKAGVKNLTKITPDIFGEPLGKIVPPISKADAVKLGFEFDTTDASKGLELLIENGRVTHGKSKIYSIRELVEVTYRALDAQREFIEGVRYTPA